MKSKISLPASTFIKIKNRSDLVNSTSSFMFAGSNVISTRASAEMYVSAASVAVRPVVNEKSFKTQRLNQAIELGYFPPIKTTKSVSQ